MEARRDCPAFPWGCHDGSDAVAPGAPAGAGGGGAGAAALPAERRGPGGQHRPGHRGGAAKALAALESGVIDVRHLGAACDGVDTGADTPAFRGALAQAALRPYGATIRVPAGRCLLSEGLSAALVHNQALSIEGAGADVSELVFTADTDGVAITLPSANAWLRSGTLWD